MKPKGGALAQPNRDEGKFQREELLSIVGSLRPIQIQEGEEEDPTGKNPSLGPMENGKNLLNL